jgi:very-short-patch-repair endonuclease
MATFPPAVLAHFARRHGIAARDELLAAGLSRHGIHALCRAQNLVPVLKGVYRIPAVPFDHAARCAAVCAAHSNVVISGPAAGRLWDFRCLPPDRRIHVIAPPRSHPTIEPWVVPYRTAAIRGEDRIHRSDGIVITSRARTALDLSRHLDDDLDVLSVIEQAMSDGGLSDAAMRAVAVEYLSPRRPWLTRFLLTLDGQLGGGAADSHHEVRLGDALASAGVVGLERQYRIDLPRYGPVRFDLAIPSMRWAIEVDVFPTHAETAGRRSDQLRDAAAASAGWDVTRIIASQFGSEFGAAVGGLRREYDQRRLAA